MNKYEITFTIDYIYIKNMDNGKELKLDNYNFNCEQYKMMLHLFYQNAINQLVDYILEQYKDIINKKYDEINEFYED